MITGLLHWAISASNIWNTLDFYCGILGFHYLFHLNDEKGDPKTFYTRLGESQYLEIFLSRERFGCQPMAAEHSVPYGYHHLTLVVPDLPAAQQRLLQGNYPIEGCQESRLWVRDPDGNLLELVAAGEI